MLSIKNLTHLASKSEARNGANFPPNVGNYFVELIQSEHPIIEISCGEIPFYRVPIIRNVGCTYYWYPNKPIYLL